jgi:hypothetical protein
MHIFKLVGIIALLAACNVVPPKEPTPHPDTPTIVFSVLQILRPSPEEPSRIQLLETQASPGKLKKKSEAPLSFTHYLGIGIYRNGIRMDTLTLEHPLYKHIEYVNDQGELAVLDTMLTKADFFIRFQSLGAANEIRIFETVNKIRLDTPITIKK